MYLSGSGPWGARGLTPFSDRNPVEQPEIAACRRKAPKNRAIAPVTPRQRNAVSSKLRNFRLWMRSSGISRSRSIARTPIKRCRATWVL